MGPAALLARPSKANIKRNVRRDRMGRGAHFRGDQAGALFAPSDPSAIL